MGCVILMAVVSILPHTEFGLHSNLRIFIHSFFVFVKLGFWKCDGEPTGTVHDIAIQDLYAFQLRERGSQALRCPSLAKKPFGFLFELCILFYYKEFQFWRKNYGSWNHLEIRCFVWWILCNVTNLARTVPVLKYRSIRKWPVFELAYVRTF